MRLDTPRQKRVFSLLRTPATVGNLRLTLGFLIFGCLVLSTSRLPAQLADSAWPDYGGGYANQHRSPFVGPLESPSILWEFDLSTLPTPEFARGYHQPILLPDGTIVFNTADSANDQIVALNQDGTLRWHLDDSNLSPWLAADVNDQIYTIRGYYAGPTTTLRSVDFDGNHLWLVNLPETEPRQNGPAVGLDGNVYAANDFSPLTAVTPAGTTAWTSTVDTGYYVNPAIATDGTIIMGGKQLTALNPDGSIFWQHPARTAAGKNPKYLSPAIADDGTIYAGQIAYTNLVALNPDGTERWARPDLEGTPAVGPDGTVYVIPESGILYALDPTDGATLWTFATGKTDYYNSEGVTIDVNGNLFVSNQEGLLMSFTLSGDLLWSMDLAPDIDGFIGLSAPVLGNDGTLFVVGGLTGKVFAIVPEPSSLGILLSAAIVLLTFAIARRRRCTDPGARIVFYWASRTKRINRDPAGSALNPQRS